MILVTGAAGSVGRRLLQRLGNEAAGVDIAWYDRHLDVTDAHEVAYTLGVLEPSVIFHLAGAKHAPEGELDPWKVAEINVEGTRNILAARGDAKVIFASTCKACDPETAYGASKLIAERMVLNAGGVVVRYFNIPEADGNVFRLWESLPESEPIPWTDCWRFFSPMEDCLALTLASRALPSGRYAPDPGPPVHLHSVAKMLHPGRELCEIPRRRGDRMREPRLASCETADAIDGFLHITNPHDPVAMALSR